MACSPSSFKVRCSTFDVRRSASGPGGLKVIYGESVRRVSGETPMSLPGSQRRFGLCNWAFSAPPPARRACRPELRIEGRLGSQPRGMGAPARRSGVGPGAVPCGSRKALTARHLGR